MSFRTHSQLMLIPTFQGRYEYLRLAGIVGDPTFGSERYVNQKFYGSHEWRRTRMAIIARDLGNDLGVEGYPIHSRPLIHHLNPLDVNQIVRGSDSLLDPENLITTSHATHNAIHYGDANLLPQEYVERRPGDTTLWTSRRSAS